MFQVFVLMALFGGVYVTCMIGLLPDKTKETFERFFAMVSAYLEANDLPTNFEGHFFMTDFEKNIRNRFHLFWPSVRGGNQVGGNCDEGCNEGFYGTINRI